VTKNASTSFTPEQAFEFMQKMWNPFGFSLPGMPAPQVPGAQPAPTPFPSPLGMFATLDPAEVERKIAELRVIENWLAMSLSFMQMSIKTLELQKASLEALHAGVAAASEPAPKRHKEKAKEPREER